jgi:hypothetical protein
LSHEAGSEGRLATAAREWPGDRALPQCGTTFPHEPRPS